ncbi:hypothetical protein C1I98_12190 [Spongiactinospora gelatinilytica]|uniref:Uncharacterized protein n=1 Tax=Spongiactinospora gelatinilytica TaxID=2666298 RepID=A0A2W2HF06_9ACTN|nr:hypothetical protein C1I98_12190 [Spongiactinospora gelatinilytica]
MTGMSAKNFVALIAGLVALCNDRLDRQPSNRALAKAATVWPTIGDWLRGEQFPQWIDPLLKLVRAVRAHAAQGGLPPLAHLADEQRWRRRCQDEARRHIEETRTMVQAEQGRAVTRTNGSRFAEYVAGFTRIHDDGVADG